MTAQAGIDTDKAIRMLLGGKQMRSIAAHFGVDRGQLLAALRAVGVEFRGTIGREQPRERGRLAARVGGDRESRYAQRYWVNDPSHWPNRGRPGGYWVHPDPQHGHGDNNSYVYYGCRCPDCRAANANYMWYIRRGLTPPRDD